MSTSFLNRLGEIDFSHTIERLVEGFTGREWLFERLDNWLNQEDGKKFYLLTGEPGVGKSAIAARLTQLWTDDNPEARKLAAYHFCRAGDVETVRPGRVVRSLAVQLVNTLPQYKEALKEVIDPVYLNIKSEINIGTLSNSQVTGIYIENLKNLDPREEFRLLIQEPLAALSTIYASLGETPPSVKVLLIDSLDEAATTTGQENMVTLLASLYQARETLPPWIRFLLTARPDQSVLTRFLPLQSEKIEEEAKNLSDIERYIQGRVDDQLREVRSTPEPPINNALVSNLKPLQKRLEEADLTAEKLVGEVKDLSHGNFLYTKLLLNSIESGEQSIKNLSALPKNLNDIYHRILRYRCSFRGWLKRYQPILGALSVAQESITLEQLTKFIGIELEELKQDLEVFQQFLDQSEDEQGNVVYSIFHQSLREYLLDKQNHDFWCDAKEQHESIIEYFENKSKKWQDLEAIDLYGLRYLAQHLVKGDQIEKLHTLLSLEKNGKNSWFKVKDEGDPAGFLADVELAWSQADEAYDRESGKSIGLQCRYALIKSSINSLAEVPTALMIALVKHQYWKPAKAFAYARQIPSPEERFESLTSLADQLANLESLRSQVLQAALEAALAIPYKEPCALALITLADKIPPTLLPIALAGAEAFWDVEVRARVLTALANRFPDVLPKALDAALAIQFDYDRARALIALSDKLPDVLPKALDAALAIQFDYDRARALIALSDKLPELLPKALEVSLAIQDEKIRTQELTWLADKLPPDLLPTALAGAEALLDEHCRAQLLTVLADKRPEVLPQALKSALAIQDEFSRADALTALGDKIPPDLLPQALKSTLAIQDEFYRAKALSALADKLPDLPLKALEVIQSIQNEFSRAQVLSALVDKLPLNLFPQALETALAIQSEECCIQALAALAGNLPPALLNRVLEAALAIQDKKLCAQALITLADKFPNILPKALEAAQSIQDQSNCAETLIALADKLPSEHISQVLEVVLSIQSESSRSGALVAIANKLPPHLRLKALEAAVAIQKPCCIEALLALADEKPEVLPKALAASQAIQDDYYRGQVLGRLVDKLPLNLLPKCLEAAQSIPYEFFRFDVLAALVDKLPEALPEALATALAFKNEYGGPAWALLTLADKLPEVLPKALEAAQAIQDDYKRCQALLALADKLPEVLPEALTTALAIQDEYNRAIALVALADKLPEVLPKALEAAQAIQDDYKRCQALLALADKLPEVLPEALATAMAAVETLNELERTNAFMRFADRLTTDLLPQALVVVLAIHDEHERAKALAVLAGKLPEALLKALEAAQAMRENFFRAEVLTALALPLINAPNRFELWKNLLHFLSYRNRPALLSDIAALTPVVVALGKKEAARGIAQAIEDVSRWWV